MRALAVAALLVAVAGCNQVLGVDKFTSIDASAEPVDSPIVDGPRTIDSSSAIDAPPAVDGMLPDAPASCGDHMTEPPEQCDTGGVDTATCDSDCTDPTCGDGHTNMQYVNPANGKTEQCDGGGVDTSTCNQDCTTAVCGDGYTNTAAGETCDNTGAVDSASCDADCTDPSCGDGHANMQYVVPGTGKTEQCDKGAANSDAVGSTCDTKCQIPGCGNGVVEGTEGCDDGNATNTDDCTGSCKLAACGDGVIHTTTTGTTGADGLEQCDNGANDTATCNGDSAGAASCKAPTCGDGYKNIAAGEQCDDGNTIDGDTCEHNCKLPTCGNGIKDAGEACDDGNSTNGDSCENNCTLPACGNGILDAGEQCDNGASNSNSGDCLVSCKRATCGDGYVDSVPGASHETCDDSNTLNGDGCSSTCNIEAGWTCVGAPSSCSFCGDGIVEGTEACDDRNTSSCGTCNATCTATQSGAGCPKDTGCNVSADCAVGLTCKASTHTCE